MCWMGWSAALAGGPLAVRRVKSVRVATPVTWSDRTGPSEIR